jgi:hypothetical protein
VRFFVLAILTIKFGPQVVHIAGALVKQHLGWLLAGVGLALVVGLLIWRSRIRVKENPVQDSKPGQ